MITESALQPLLALIFLLCGAVGYLPMIIIGWLPMSKRLPILKHILEGVWGLLYCIAFAATAHISYDGKIKYFTVVCYLAGAALCGFFLKLPIQTIAHRLHKKSIIRKENKAEKLIEAKQDAKD